MFRRRRTLPPPILEAYGRVAWYDDAHRGRLRLIAALLERGCNEWPPGPTAGHREGSRSGRR